MINVALDSSKKAASKAASAAVPSPRITSITAMKPGEIGVVQKSSISTSYPGHLILRTSSCAISLTNPAYVWTNLSIAAAYQVALLEKGQQIDLVVE